MSFRARSVKGQEEGFESVFTEGVRLPDAVRFPQYTRFVEDVGRLREVEGLKEALRQGCLGDGYVLARLLGYDDPSWHWDNVHLWIMNELLPSWREEAGGQFFLFAPRGTGKTALEEVEIVQEILRNPNVTIGVGSWELKVAERITRAVKNQLEKPILQWLFPGILPTERERRGNIKWTEDMMTVKRSGTATKDATLSAFSLQSPATSQHFDLVLLDDVVEAENSKTEDSLNAVKRAMRDMRSLRKTPQSRIECRGTMWDPEDWHCGVIMQSGYWKKTVIPALLEDPAVVKEPFKPEFSLEVGSLEPWGPIRGYLKTPIFPSVKPLSALEIDLVEQGEYHFTGQMLGKLHEAGGAYWPEPCLYFDETRLEPPFASYQFADLAVEKQSQGESTGDDNVLILVHAFPGLEYPLWLWDIYIAQTWGDLARRIFDNYEEWGAPATIEEIGAFQNFEATFQEEARRRGKMVPHSAVKHRRDGGRVKNRIKDCGRFFEGGRILSRNPASCKSPAQQEAFLKYERQKRRWPKVAHDDILDCLTDACMYALPPMGNGGSARVHTFRQRPARLGY